MRILFLICAVFIGRLASAQSATEEALDKACHCFDAVDFPNRAFAELHQVADSCIEQALYTNLTGVLEENKASLEDSPSMLRVAKRFHTHLFQNCQGFQVFSKRMAQKEVAEIKEETPRTTGLLYSINTEGQFPVVIILDEQGQSHEFLWFREFDGSTRFFDGMKPYKSTLVEVYWEELELYDAKNKTYAYYKEIVLIEERKTLSKKERRTRIKAYRNKKKDKQPKKRKKKSERKNRL